MSYSFLVLEITLCILVVIVVVKIKIVQKIPNREQRQKVVKYLKEEGYAWLEVFNSRLSKDNIDFNNCSIMPGIVSIYTSGRVIYTHIKDKPGVYGTLTRLKDKRRFLINLAMLDSLDTILYVLDKFEIGEMRNEK